MFIERLYNYIALSVLLDQEEEEFVKTDQDNINSD